MITPAWTQFKPHPIQQAAWLCPKRFVAIPAGRGSGKTELAKRRLVRFLPVRKPWPDPRYFYGAPTRQQAKRIAWDALRALIPPVWVAEESVSELRIKTCFNSTIFIVGLDEPARIEGDQWDGCVLDESCDLRPKTFDLSVAPALAWRNGWCWRIGVPKRQGPSAVEFRECFEKAITSESDWAGFTWPSSDILSPETLAYAREQLDALDYAEQFDARFQNASGGIFHAFKREYNVRPCTYYSDKPVIIGMDFNVDPMAWILGHVIENRMEWFDEIWQRNTNTPRSLEILCQRYAHHRGGFQLYPDASGTQRKTSAARSDLQLIASHEVLQSLGRTMHVAPSNPPVDDRFAVTNALLCNANGERRMYFDSRCVHTINDFESRYYRPGTREAADTGDLGHASDAVGYAVWRLFPLCAPHLSQVVVV